jgi:sugar (pentulose or hexulose) kinase
VYQSPEPTGALSAGVAAALLGHVAAGTFTSVDEAVQVVRTLQEATEPDPRAVQIYDTSFELYRALYARTDDLMHGLTTLAVH